jgi:O-antigen ligase
LSPEKLIKYLVPFFVFAVVSRAIEEISFFYYAVPVMCVFFIVLLFISPKFKVQIKPKKQNQESEVQHPASGNQYLLFIIPGVWFLITSLWSSYPGISAERALYFILLSIGCISAGILWVRFSNKNIFDFLLPANIFVILLCLFSLITNIPSDSWSIGRGYGFAGFFGHQNQLGSIILFTLPSVFALKIKDKGIKIKVFYFLLLSLNLFLLTLTYSRASILSLLFGVIVFLFFNKKWKTLIYSFSTVVVLVMIVFFNPSITRLTKDILNKDFPEFYSSRIWMWEPSYYAAVNGGFTGLGYGISDPGIKLPEGATNFHYEGERFIREKGNSTLALIEETGFIGLMLFILPILYFLFRIRFRMSGANKFKVQGLNRTEIDLKHYSLLILNSSVAAMLLHAQFEAWWVGVGSVQLPIFFVYTGLMMRKLK